MNLLDQLLSCRLIDACSEKRKAFDPWTQHWSELPIPTADRCLGPWWTAPVEGKSYYVGPYPESTVRERVG